MTDKECWLMLSLDYQVFFKIALPITTTIDPYEDVRINRILKDFLSAD